MTEQISSLKLGQQMRHKQSQGQTIKYLGPPTQRWISTDKTESKTFSSKHVPMLRNVCEHVHLVQSLTVTMVFLSFCLISLGLFGV